MVGEKDGTVLQVSRQGCAQMKAGAEDGALEIIVFVYLLCHPELIQTS